MFEVLDSAMDEQTDTGLLQATHRVSYRATHRVKLEAGLNCRWKDHQGKHVLSGVTHDISAGGLFFNTSKLSGHPRVGQVIRCLITLPDVKPPDPDAGIQDRWIEAVAIGKVSRVEFSKPLGIAVCSRVLRLTPRQDFLERDDSL